MSHAVDKLERRLAALDARIDAILLSQPSVLPPDWEMLVMRSGDLVERIVETGRASRARNTPVDQVPLRRTA